MDETLTYATIWFRLIERGLLTSFVLFSCIWLVRRYANTVTAINASGEKLPLSTLSTTVATPILIVILFIGYAYVDLSNGIALGPTHIVANLRGETSSPSKQQQQSIAANNNHPQFYWKGLNDAAEQQLAFWIERNIRRIYTSLANKASQPMSPQVAAKVLSLSLAIGCLNEDSRHPSREFDTYLSSMTFQEVESDIIKSMRSHGFVNPYCNELKAEMEND